MTTKAGALSFGCFFMTALSSLAYTAYSAFQRFYSPDCISTNFYFRLIVILSSAPLYFLTEEFHWPSLYEWMILAILGLVNLLYMICFLQGAEVYIHSQISTFPKSPNKMNTLKTSVNECNICMCIQTTYVDVVQVRISVA